jgi:NDP-sugar pyrophosphorylase family protein
MSAHLCNDGLPPLVLLAGGLATRLGPVTASVPKSLLTVAGEPFIAHQLRLLVGRGVLEVVICCGHLGEQIEHFVRDGSRFGCRVRYSWDGPKLLGTGGAIRKALPLLGPRFWVMYGDSYLLAPFAPMLEAFQRSSLPALMAVFANEDRWDTSNVEFAGEKIVRYDKRARGPGMQHVDYGLGLFSAEVFHSWPDSAFDLSHLQSRLVEQGVMAGYEVSERFYEIGSVAGLEETDAFLTAQLGAPLAESAYERRGPYGVRT